MPFVTDKDRKSHEERRPHLLQYPRSSDYEEISTYIIEVAEALAFNAKENYICGHNAKARDMVNVGGIGEHQFRKKLNAALRNIVGQKQRFTLQVETDDYGDKTVAELTLTVH
jgi:hypothetical protein